MASLRKALGDSNADVEISDDEKAEQELFLGISHQFGEHFLLMVVLDKAVIGCRSLIKYSLDQDSPHESRFPSQRVEFGFNVADFGFAASQHIEVEVPKGLVIRKTLIIDQSDPGLEEIPAGLWDSDEPSRPRTVAHVSLNPQSRIARALVQVTATAARQDLYWFSINSLILTSLVVASAWAVRLGWVSPFSTPPTIPSASVSLLLLGPALLLSWFSRSPEHPLVARRLGPLRRSMLINSAVLVIFAVVAAVKVTPLMWNVMWIAATGLQAVSALYLLFFLLDARAWPFRVADFVRRAWNSIR